MYVFFDLNRCETVFAYFMRQLISGFAFELYCSVNLLERLCALIQSRSFHPITDPITNSQFIMEAESKQTRNRWMRVFPEVCFQNGTNWYSWKRAAEYTCVSTIYDCRHQSLISAQSWLPEASVSGAGLELPYSQAKNSLVHLHIAQ